MRIRKDRSKRLIGRCKNCYKIHYCGEIFCIGGWWDIPAKVMNWMCKRMGCFMFDKINGTKTDK